jgi:uncharacterized protein (TIGR02594 family)
MIWLDKAKEYIGTKEIPGVHDNPKIIKLWEDAGLPFDDDETPWCAGFVGGVLHQSGLPNTKSGMARSYLTYGMKLDGPKLGAIVILERGAAPSGHVGFVTGFTSTHVKVLGGNQSNEVNETWFKRSGVLGWRWPTQTLVTSPGKEIQKLLNEFGADLEVDGIIGPLTRGAMQKLETAYHQLIKLKEAL